MAKNETVVEIVGKQVRISKPVEWSEVEKCLKKASPELLTFTGDEVLDRVDKLSDLFGPVLTMKQKLPKLTGESTADARPVAGCGRKSS
jgi:DNA primase